MADDCNEIPIPSQTGEGAQQESPLELSGPDWKESARRTAREMKDDRATLVAAGMAFYWFLAVFPGLLAAIGLLGLFNASTVAIESITKAIRAALPGDAADVLTDAVSKAGQQSDGAAVVAALLGLAVAMWSASAGMVAMQAGLDVAYDVGEERKFLKKRAVAFALLGATAVLGGLATALVVFGQPLGEAIRDNLPLDSAFVVVWTIARWTIAFLALVALFATYYYLAPNRESPRWTWVSPGGLVAAVIWLGASLAFSFYVSSFGSYGETYGSLAGVVVLLLWLYLSALAVMVGGELNSELERQSAILAGEVPRPGAGGTTTESPKAAKSEGNGGGHGSPELVRAWAEEMRRLRGEAGDAPAGGGPRALR